MFTYEVNGKTYVQKPLVIGQVKQLLNALRGLEAPQGMTSVDLIELLGDKLPSIFAIVLTEQGTSPKDKDIASLAEEFSFDFPLETAIKVVEDFFGCNPTHLYLEKLVQMIGVINPAMVGGLTSTESLASSPEGTSGEEIK